MKSVFGAFCATLADLEMERQPASDTGNGEAEAPSAEKTGGSDRDLASVFGRVMPVEHRWLCHLGVFVMPMPTDDLDVFFLRVTLWFNR
jgi:hypothetical protein